ncbi:hypothetical protein METBIDRAFT_37765 [Metschnikowia bicuspidata var. bicuspidata NRRL YB-4993]|uniref:CASTOR ACT domain-containing protein n=1 Tax=Metschnikowia bicuspidata var. bicuspidata NRRL YB-4993 TaxID=869754 RepID=A0A1A0HKD7_9ASCO|nr:hypothetical protein METBIDRAFT_37765 [Metschnikowia bicuspidata var. bicuspidata NRRL YB-4993]OBA24485.1 hypothetical protein METBIDRAFT_37765 [Metschnikowia bicuspidata var. bicuspidata NRRL YB-4993]
MSGQVYLNPSRLSILSIPRDKVWLFSSAILKLLHQEAKQAPQSNFKSDSKNDHSTSEDLLDLDAGFTDDSTLYDSEEISKMTSSTLSELSLKADLSVSLPLISDEDHHFFHIAYTPSECTVILSTYLSSELFMKPLSVCKKLGYSDVILLEKSYLNLQVDSEGEFNNSAKILELTKPFSQHNISLFFLSTHFTNIVLIPYDLKDQVIEILTENDFVFSDVSNSYILSQNYSSLSKTYPKDTVVCPATSEVNRRDTMNILADTKITPRIHRKVKLLLTGARPGQVKQSIVKASQTIAADAVPDYFAITRSSFNEISLILPGSSKQRALMGFDFRSIIGSALDVIIPVTVDLSKLPIDSAGIVAGLASSLWESVRSLNEPATERFDMNYLSMARSGVIMIPRENLDVVTRMVKNMRTDLKNNVTI